MTANTGRTNAKWMQVFIDNPTALTEVTAQLKSIGSFGFKTDSTDVTAVGDVVKNFTLGRKDAPLTITFEFDTTIYGILLAIKAAAETPLSLNVQMGILHAWVSGEPTWGITSSASAGYKMTNMMVNFDSQEIVCDFIVFGTTLPDFGTTAYT